MYISKNINTLRHLKLENALAILASNRTENTIKTIQQDKS